MPKSLGPDLGRTVEISLFQQPARGLSKKNVSMEFVVRVITWPLFTTVRGLVREIGR